MKKRKPPAVHGPTWFDQQIEEARVRGDFDNLPGKGKPLPDLGETADPLWWVKKKLKQERVSSVPETLALRREVELFLEGLGAMRGEETVRQVVLALNERIRKVNATAISGPPSTVVPLDGDKIVARWRAMRSGGPEVATRNGE
jgi:hypothetical protein